MRRSIVVPLIALLAAALLPAVASAQDEGSSLRIESVDVAGYPEVRATLGVPASFGDLSTDTVAVTEDSEAREGVVLERAASAELQLVVTIDTSGSMDGAPMEGARTAALAFVEQLPDDVAIAVVEYATDVTVVTDFDASRAEHLQGITSLEAGGRTAMFDAVIESAVLFPDPGPETSRAVILLTDGEDNESSSTIDDAAEALVSEGVTLHGVEFITDSSDRISLAAMADATGGTVWSAGDADELTAVYEALAEDLQNRYIVNYVSESSGTTELVVEVITADASAAARRTLDLPLALPEEPAEEEPATEDEASVAVPEALAPTVVQDAGLGRPALLIGTAAWFLALALLLLSLLRPREARSQLGGIASLSRRRRGMGTLAHTVSDLADRSLEKQGYRRGLNSALERAGIDLRPGEFAVLVVCGAIALGTVGALVSNLFVGLLLALLAVVGARLVVRVRATRRQARFAEQLGDTLQLLSGSLRAGYSLMQAVDAVAREAASPAREEFGRLVVETRLGRDFGEALSAVADRVDSEDFRWVIEAIEINREVGGDLAEVLDTVAGTIRERNQIRRQVRVLSAEGRLSGYVLLALPFGVGVIMYFTNREYLGELIHGGLLGFTLIGLALVMMTAGIVWMRKVVKFEF